MAERTASQASEGLSLKDYDGPRYEAGRLRDPAVRRRLRVMERGILDAAAGKALVLDLGCGTGRFTVQLSADRVVGLDRSRSMLGVARTRGVSVVLGDANRPPFRDSTFDMIVSTDQVFTALKQEHALRECHRMLAPGGVLAFSFATDLIWTPRNPLRLTKRPGFRGERPSELIELATQIGFALELLRLWRWLRWYPYLLPAPPIPRLRLWNQGILVFRKAAR